jgi:hypothetical protein
VLEPKQRFADWLTNGLPETASDPDVFDARLRQLEVMPDDDVCDRCRELRDELASLGPELAHVHVRACLVYAARLLEEGAWDEAEAAAVDAAASARRATDAHAELTTRRLRVGAWLGRLELERAFAELDAILASTRESGASESEERALLRAIFGGPAGPAPVLASKRFLLGLDALEEAKRDIAFHVQAVADEHDDEWRAALERLAERLRPIDGAAAAIVSRRVNA